MSRLLDSSENERVRNFLESRNLYTPNDPYDANNNEVVNTINSIAGYLLPFKSIDIRNTAIGRAVGLKTGGDTDLANIGARMLAAQLYNTAKSAAVAAYFPSMTFDPFNAKYDAFKRKIDFEITKRANQNAFGRFFQNITRSYRAINPFSKNTTNEEYIRQSGVGQIQSLVKNLNDNWYVKSSQGYLGAIEEHNFAIDSFDVLHYTRSYFPNILLVADQLFSPYNYFPYASESNLNIKIGEDNSREGEDRTYANEINTAIKWMGKTKVLDRRYSLNEYNALGLPDDNTNQIIWGRDGIETFDGKTSAAFTKNASLRGDSEAEDALVVDTTNMEKFNARRGLLHYTSELLNASDGKFIDQTRKIFKNPKEGNIEGKQGSGLFVPPANKYTNAMDSYNGVRQHTVIDQYNRFAKAIRFEGNYLYGGHENSVIFDSVMPKITPYTKDVNEKFSPENNPNRNLMFSIENLAFELDGENTLQSETYGKPMQFPSCQKGPNGARIMWFAPYDVDVTEQAIASYSETQFLGRGEPIYTYSNSERQLTLNFKLLIDHPPQAKNRTTDRSVREFFQFGGYEDEEGFEDFENLPELKKKGINLTHEINSIIDVHQVNIPPNTPNSMDLFFPNDEPKEGNNDASVVAKILFENYEYDVDDVGGVTEKWEKNYGKNNDFEFLINNIVDLYLNPEFGKLYNVSVIGWTSQLHNSAYNQALGLRRAESLADYLNTRIELKWKKDAVELGINITPTSRGEVSDASTDTDQVFELNSVLARRAEIILELKDENETEESNQLSPEEKNTVKEKRAQLMNVKKQINRAKVYDQKKTTTCGFNQYVKETKQSVGYDSFIKVDGQSNLFQPIFYSQTPKDFHDRLTFLHQCTRQGPPVRKYEVNGDSKVSVSAKNSVFGRQPICVLRLGDQWYTKVVIENIQFAYSNTPWDTNPEGYGMQFMGADITMQMKVIGGQSLYGPISVLQNAVTFNYYANSTFAKEKYHESKAAYHFEKAQKDADAQRFKDNNPSDTENLTGSGVNMKDVTKENITKE